MNSESYIFVVVIVKLSWAMFGSIPWESDSVPCRRSELSNLSLVSVHLTMNREGNQRSL